MSYRCIFTAKGKGHPMHGYEVKPIDFNSGNLLPILKDVHDNRFRTAMKRELEPDLYKRPMLKEVKDRFVNELNNIVERYPL